MSNSIKARHNGDNYQARHFWMHALDLLDPSSNTVKVAYEWGQVKSFDDIAIWYDPPLGQAHQYPVTTHFMQVKWQTSKDKHFGYTDLTDPKFINAEKISLIERLHDVKKDGNDRSRVSLVTTARISEGDPLAEIVSNEDGILRLGRLFQGKTARSKMGKVREVWREKLGVETDEDLRHVLEGFAIRDGQSTLEEIRERLDAKARSFGININEKASSASDYRFDSLARQLVVRNIKQLDRNGLLHFLGEEGIQVAPSLNRQNHSRSLAIVSFKRFGTTDDSFDSGNMLSFLNVFDGRYLSNDAGWVLDVADPVARFLEDRVKSIGAVRLTIDAHSSIAYVAGRTLHLKCGVRTELVQNGRRGVEIWHSEDGSGSSADSLVTDVKPVGSGLDIAVAISLTRPTINDVVSYVNKNLPGVGKIIHFELPNKPSQSGVRGGEHAAMLADQIAEEVRGLCQDRGRGTVHLFAAAPNSFMFFLGQQTQAIGACKMYEFDFDGEREGGYFPSV